MLSEPWPWALLGSLSPLAPQTQPLAPPAHTSDPQQLLQGCFQEAISCRGRFFFPKEPEVGNFLVQAFHGKPL